MRFCLIYSTLCAIQRKSILSLMKFVCFSFLGVGVLARFIFRPLNKFYYDIM